MPAASSAAHDLAAQDFRPAGPQPGFVGGTLTSLKDIMAHRELLGLLTRREIKARYKDSVLGFLWSLIRPLTQLFIYWLVLGQFLGAERGIPNFAVYIFTGLAAWQLFVDILTGGTGSIVGNSGLIKKVYVPREIFPLAAIGSALFNFAMQLVILFGFIALRGDFAWGSRWVYFPLSLALLMVWATTLGLLLGALNVYLRDIQYLVEIATIILFWASPIVYSFTMVQAHAGRLLQQIYLANPMTLVISGFQRAFWTGGDIATPLMVQAPLQAYDAAGNAIEGLMGPAQQAVDAAGNLMYDTPANAVITHLSTRLGLALLVSLVLLWLAQRVFARLQANFAQEL